jgi:hypothetical protein
MNISTSELETKIKDKSIKKKKSPSKKPLKNCIRKLSKNIKLHFQTKNIAIGTYYQIIHCIIMGLGIFLIIFDTNIFHLTILLIMTTLDCFANIVLHDCPLTILEQKYLGTSLTEQRISFFKNMDICYIADDSFESTIELLTNVWSIISVKILCLLLMRFINFPVSGFSTK